MLRRSLKVHILRYEKLSAVLYKKHRYIGWRSLFVVKRKNKAYFLEQCDMNSREMTTKWCRFALIWWLSEVRYKWVFVFVWPHTFDSLFLPVKIRGFCRIFVAFDSAVVYCRTVYFRTTSSAATKSQSWFILRYEKLPYIKFPVKISQCGRET